MRRGWQKAVTLTRVVLAGACLVSAGACAKTIPSKYLKQAESGVSLTSVVNQPKAYSGKVIILGGVLVEERRVDKQVWLHLKNRPLDVDYQPHRDASGIESESGLYWVVLNPEGLPPSYKDWARMTVVGRVMPPRDEETTRAKGNSSEPILGALYLKGWGYGLEQHSWEASQDANYLSSSPLVISPIQAQ